MTYDPVWIVIFWYVAYFGCVVVAVAALMAVICLIEAYLHRLPGESLWTRFLVEVRGVLNIHQRRVRHGRGGGRR